VIITRAPLPGVLELQPRVFSDARGFFMEAYREETLAAEGVPRLVQWNHSRSTQGTLRGLHYQLPHAQGKLVRVLRGAIIDVAVDIRRGSPTFAQWHALELSDVNNMQLWIPPGFAHGFCVFSSEADVLYGCSTYYRPDADHGIRWNDPRIGIAWPVADPLLSDKDTRAPLLDDATVLPEYDG
jgi:dTDP-4-dehydrorhamnose 3,5-epimerase